MSFESYSQAGQDRWVWEILEHKQNGFFLDIGSGHARDYSNSYGLEQKGWGGIMCDLHHYQEDPDSKQIPRRCFFLKGDAKDFFTLARPWIVPEGTKCFPTPASEYVIPMPVDYLSIDINGDSAKALAHFLDNGFYRIITIEHDFYTRGCDLRNLERHLLRGAGYDLVCENVSWGQGPYEDWWAFPALVSQAQRDKFRCRNRWWRDIPHIMDDL